MKNLGASGKRLIVIIAAMLVILTASAGCGEAKESGAHMSAAAFQIVTSFYPMYVATINITKDIPGVEVTNMTEPQRGCLHDYALTTKDLKKLDKADVLVINGAGMESFIEKVVKQMPKLKVLDASTGIELLKDEKTGEENPHVWVGISGAVEQAKNIGKQLAEADNKHAGMYEENTKAYVGKLEALKSRMHEKLDKIKNKNIVTFHEAFPYFAKEFNLDIKAVVEREPGSEPSAGELADTIDAVRAAGVKALFAEPQYPKKSADMIARETGAKVYVLDPAATGEANGDTDAYLKIMEANLKTLEEALSANE